MSNDRGVFTLGAYRRAQVEGQGVNIDDVWLSPSYGVPFSYLAGGYVYVPGSDDSYYSIVDKLQFGSDSISRSPSADLDYGGYSRNPVASSTAAYWMSGKKDPNQFGPSSWTSKTSKTTFSTDTTAASTNYPSSPGLGWLSQGSTATETAAYIGGGDRTPGVITTQLQKLTFATDVFSNAPRFPHTQRHTGDALGNQTHGYWSGGTQVPASTPSGSTGHGAHTIIARFTYSTDTHSNVGTIPAPRKLVAASGNANEGYLYGGIDGHPAPANENVSTVIKITYATDTSSLNPSNLTEHPVTSRRGSGNTSSGYVTGAGNPSTNSNTFKFDYSTGTQSTPGSLKRPVTASGVANASSQSYGRDKYPIERWTDGWKGTYDGGYWAGGQSTNPGGWPASGNAYRSSIFKVNFSTDVGEISPSKLPKTMGQFHYVVADDVNGYLIGGDPSPDQEVMRVSMVSETASLLPNASPSQTIRDNNDMGITYGKLYGYGQGGNNETLSPDEGTSSTAKFTFATETSGDAPAAKWSGSPAPRIRVSSVGNITSHGYFTGGMTYKQSQPEYGKSDIAKMTYATETISEIPANLNGSYFYSATMSSETAGYITSHQFLPSWGSNQQMNKITFATDTQSLLGGASSPERSQANGTGNASAGYVGGGYRSTPAYSFMTHVYKLDYATETAMSLITSNWQGETTTRGLYRGAAFGPLSAGRAAVGAPTPTPTPGYDPGNYELAAGIPNHGYYMGGNSPSAQGSTNSMKMSFATDTLSTGVQLSEKYSTGGYGGGKMASSPSHAYAVYGRNPNSSGGETGNTYVRKVQYSNDTASSAPTATNEPSYAGFVAGTTTKLYYAGGTDNAGVPLGTRTNIRKLTYSNDSWATTPQSSANYSNPSGWPRNGSTSGGTPEYMLMGPSITANDYKTTIAKFTYATDTGIMSIPGVNGDNSQAYAVGNSNDTHWYIARGNTMPGYGKQTNIGKFTFATNTYESAALVDTTNDYNSQNGTGAVNNGMIAGYWAGAHLDQQDATSTLKVTYSTDTVSRGPNIPSGRYSPSASSGGGGNAFSGTTVQEWGNGGTRVPNVV